MAEPDVGPLVASFIDFTGSDDAVALQMLQVGGAPRATCSATCRATCCLTRHAPGTVRVLVCLSFVAAASRVPARSSSPATNWQLEEAVQLFFGGGAEAAGAQQTDAHGGSAVGPAGGAGNGSRDATPPPRSSSPPPPPAAAAAAVAAGGGGMGGSMGGGEEVVRAPLPVRREALYGDAYALNRPSAAAAGRTPGGPSVPVVVDGFRDFGGEAGTRARARGEGQQGGEGGAARQASLASLFEPPYDILFAGSFDQAKQRAGAEGKWLLVNVQSTGEFASHMLNRDVWAVPAVKETISTYFLLWQARQVDAAAAEGAKVCGYYQVEALPVVMVLHPSTGQRKRCWQGAFSADQLLEDLMPFIDRGPVGGAPGAGGEARPPKKQRDVATGGEGEAEGAGAVGSGEEDEEEQLRLALAASLEGHTEEVGGDTKGRRGEADGREQGGAAGAGRDDTLHAAQGEQAQQGALARGAAEEEVELPEEPAVGTPASCRIAIRCPDGSRLQRRFLSSHSLQVLLAFCNTACLPPFPFHCTVPHHLPAMPVPLLSHSLPCSPSPHSPLPQLLRAWCRQQVPEAAAGRPFRLSQALPGSAPLNLSSPTTIADAGLANSLLALAWD
ncbi:unnamed protein product [Closterium sp. NIES-64]|nr:unnamed protein product [Closterium sp. NIES-64]